MTGNYEVAIVGNGWVGKAYNKVFPEAVVYDEPQIVEKANEAGQLQRIAIETGRKAVNACDMAIVCVPTNPTESGELDMSIVEDVVDWIDTPLIMIKSALQPGTTDRLVDKTGKKISVSVEMVGEGRYFVPFWKYPHQQDPISHNFLIVGGEDETATRCADFLWNKMSPDISIHIVTAVEAEITKLMENTWGAMKVTYANTIYDLCEKYDANYTRVLQAWGIDGRTEKMHMRVTPFKRGWKSKCFDKDIPALIATGEKRDVNMSLIKGLLAANEEHLQHNDADKH